jgi:hypothetical protein
MATFIDWVFQPHVAEGGTSDARTSERHNRSGAPGFGPGISLP